MHNILWIAFLLLSLSSLEKGGGATAAAAAEDYPLLQHARKHAKCGHPFLGHTEEYLVKDIAYIRKHLHGTRRNLMQVLNDAYVFPSIADYCHVYEKTQAERLKKSYKRFMGEEGRSILHTAFDQEGTLLSLGCCRQPNCGRCDGMSILFEMARSQQYRSVVEGIVEEYQARDLGERERLASLPLYDGEPEGLGGLWFSLTKPLSGAWATLTGSAAPVLPSPAAARLHPKRADEHALAAPPPAPALLRASLTGVDSLRRRDPVGSKGDAA